jgi:hypothetical protein
VATKASANTTFQQARQMQHFFWSVTLNLICPAWIRQTSQRSTTHPNGLSTTCIAIASCVDAPSFVCGAYASRFLLSFVF